MPSSSSYALLRTVTAESQVPGVLQSHSPISNGMHTQVTTSIPQYGATLSGVNIFAKEDAETKRLDEIQREKKQRKREQANTDKTIEAVMKSEAGRPYEKTFSWEGLNYTVPVPGGERRLLHDVYGYVKPGTLMALMDTNGAGKTTCLDVLAQRKNIGVITGDILVDGRPLSFDFARLSGVSPATAPVHTPVVSASLSGDAASPVDPSVPANVGATTVLPAQIKDATSTMTTITFSTITSTETESSTANLTA
ncbi:ATP-binding cassette transporter snq2 [Stygiomarasmius scandens]|uniref:ATP-binding cassette transporter snq2 n=1 Tax=Marasmiellus scandens TaxID=2682957 RepID=A0ABR1JQW2_9AGAR